MCAFSVTKKMQRDSGLYPGGQVEVNYFISIFPSRPLLLNGDHLLCPSDWSPFQEPLMGTAYPTNYSRTIAKVIV